MGGFDGAVTKTTRLFGLKLFAVIGIGVAALLLIILLFLSLWMGYRKRSTSEKMMKLPVHCPQKQPSPHQLMPDTTSKEPLSERSCAGNTSEDRLTGEREFVHVRHGSLENASSAERVKVCLLSALPTSDTGKTAMPTAISSHSATAPGTIASKIGEMALETGNVASDMDGETVLMDILKNASNSGGRTALDINEPMSYIRKTTSDLNKNPLEIRPTLSSSTTNTSSTKETFERTPSFSAQSNTPSDVSLEVSHLAWGHSYSFQELEIATNSFSDSSIVGKGGYGIVYHGILLDGSSVAVKKLMNNRGQAEREFKVEVEAIGRVRHKNLVCLLGYCIEGPLRMLVYEYIDNGNLDQWLHGSLGEKKPIPWNVRMKIIVGTAKGLAYLHEGLEPKVVHRDIKSSNILLDSQWNPKISDFGLAKVLGAEHSHASTRVMGTFGYIAPEYASTGLLNEKSDVYSFGVLLMELITGRDPVDYKRPVGQVNLVDWLKMMVGSRQLDQLVDPRLEVRGSLRSLKRALLLALRCVHPHMLQRPNMSHVVRALETKENPFRSEEQLRNMGHRLLRTRSNPHHLRSILQSQGISLVNSTNMGGGQKDKKYMLQRAASKGGALNVVGWRGYPIDCDGDWPDVDSSSTSTASHDSKDSAVQK